MSQNSSQQTKPNYCMCVLPLPARWLTGSASMDKREYFILLPKQKKTERKNVSYYKMQIKYENHTDENTNLHQIYTAPVRHRGRNKLSNMITYGWKTCP